MKFITLEYWDKKLSFRLLLNHNYFSLKDVSNIIKQHRLHFNIDGTYHIIDASYLKNCIQPDPAFGIGLYEPYTGVTDTELFDFFLFCTHYFDESFLDDFNVDELLSLESTFEEESKHLSIPIFTTYTSKTELRILLFDYIGETYMMLCEERFPGQFTLESPFLAMKQSISDLKGLVKECGKLDDTLIKLLGV